MQGSELVLAAAHAEGVRVCFMVPGGLDDAFMPPMTATDGLTTIVAAFEGGAAYMADGYARASHGLGLCFGIGGPGILNMATALAAAKLDGSPVLAVSGEVPTSWEGMGGFQDASGAALDDRRALIPVTGLSESVESPALLPHHLRSAVTQALSRREPVHLSIPTDVQKAPAADEWVPIAEGARSPRLLDERAMAEALSVLTGPEPPRTVVVLAGPGATGHTGLLVEVAERYDIPVATTLAGKGVFPDDHPLALGVFGYGATRWATEAILEDDVDVLIVLGSALTQRDTFQWDRRMLPRRALVHVARDPVFLGRTWPTPHAVVGHTGLALERLLHPPAAVVDGLESGRAHRRAALAAVRERGPRCYDAENRTSDAQPMHPARAVTELRAAFPADTVLCVDSGAHRAWYSEYWEVLAGGGYLSLTNLGPMGGAIPLGIGAKLARPEHPLVVATGDGCMLMHGMELHTAARYGVPVVVALMNNRSYGNIWYRAHAMGPGPEALTDISGIDWVGLARSLGARAEAIDTPDRIAPAVERALQADGPTLLDVRVDKTYPTPVAPWRAAVQEWEDHH